MVIPRKFFVIDASKFRRRYKKIIQVSIRYATPWYVYTIDVNGLVKKIECNVAVDSARAKVATVCREVEKAKEFLLMPILFIEPSKYVLTVVTVD